MLLNANHRLLLVVSFFFPLFVTGYAVDPTVADRSAPGRCAVAIKKDCSVLAPSLPVVWLFPTSLFKLSDHDLSVSLSLSLSLSVCLSVFLCVSVSLSLFLPPSLPLSVCPSVCLSPCLLAIACPISRVVGDVRAATSTGGETLATMQQPKSHRRRRRRKTKGDPGDIDDYKGTRCASAVPLRPVLLFCIFICAKF